MSHEKFHAILKPARAAAKAGDVSALAAVVSAGDELYHRRDWTDMSETDNRIYGMMVPFAFELGKSFAQFRESMTGQIALALLEGNERRMKDVAQMLWKDV